MRLGTLLGLVSSLLVTLAGSSASAQWGYPPAPQPQPYNPYNPYGPPPQPYPPGPGYPPRQQPGYYGPGYSAPQTPKSTALEIGYLYATAAAYGVGTGIWLDAEIGVEDPGLALIAPLVIGAAAPVAVYIADRKPMPRGMPAAIATGMIIGAGEGLGVAAFQHVTANKANEWGFKGLARAEVIGGLVGGAAGYGAYRLIKPSPKTSLFVASAAVWGTAIGDAIAGGASNGDWGQANDTIGLGGLIGFNAALAGSAGLSLIWIPSWNQIGWMWLGFGLGALISTPVYIAYAGGDHDPRRGLIFQGVAGAVGVGVGALIGTPDSPAKRGDNEEAPRPAFARVLGGSLLPVRNGLGAQVIGELW